MSYIKSIPNCYMVIISLSKYSQVNLLNLSKLNPKSVIILRLSKKLYNRYIKNQNKCFKFNLIPLRFNKKIFNPAPRRIIIINLII